MSGGFVNRAAGGVALGEALLPLVPERTAVVLALPRGGVVTGCEVARMLGAPLDVVIVRKLGTPGMPELAMGAIARGVRVLNDSVIEQAGVTPGEIDAVVEAETREVERREALYRAGRPTLELEGKTVVLVDDGLATGSTMLAAVRAVRAHRPQRLIVAVPVAPRETCERLRSEVDELVCLAMPEPFIAIGTWYDEFTQVSDAEVQDLMELAERTRQAISRPPSERFRRGAHETADR
jgi:putative phosphoribosyl transferase